MGNPKRPREYAAEILQLKTREERKLALAKVPIDFRDIVTLHVNNAFDLARSKKRRQQQ